MAFTGLVRSFNLDEVILKDIIYRDQSELINDGRDDKCKDEGNTRFSYNHTDSPSDWNSNNAAWETTSFLAEMEYSHPDDPNKSWTVRFGKGGAIYSMRSGYGEAIPPQTNAASPWVDEVTQSVSVDIVQNEPCSGDPTRCYYIHQAGTYFKDKDYLDKPFYSPSVVKHCEGNTCIFGTWGQIASIPTAYKSDLLYIHRYRNCGNGVIEYTQMFVGYVGGQLAYLNMPWAGVRGTSLPDLHLHWSDGTVKTMKENDIHWWGDNSILPFLHQSAGYTTFSQALNSAEDEHSLNEKAALSYVHGTADEYNDPTNKYFRQAPRLRFGRSRRDFTVFTVNGRLTFPNGEMYAHRQYLINDSFGNIKERAEGLKDGAYGDMITESDFNGRKLEVYQSDGIFGVEAASEQCGDFTTCATYIPSSGCVGSTVPSSKELVPFFTIKCGTSTYFGPDRYHFAPEIDEEGMIRSYVCDGQQGVVPEWKLLGFFPKNESCSALLGAAYDPTLCDLPNSTPYI